MENQMLTKYLDRSRTVNLMYLFVIMKVGFTSSVLVPFFTDWGKISLFQVQLLQSWFMFCVFVMEVPTGAIADRYGRKTSLLAGNLLAAIGFLIYGSIPRIEIFILGEFIIATAVALISGADKALLYDTLKEEGRVTESRSIMGRNHSLHLWGMFIAAPIGSFFADRLGLNAPMLLSAIPSLICVLIVWQMSEPKIHTEESESERYLTVIKDGFKYFVTHKILMTMMIDGVLVNVAGYFVIWLYQPLLKLESIPIVYFGLFHALLVAVEAVVSFNFTRLEKLCGSAKGYLRLSALLTSASFMMVAILPNIWTILLFVILAGGLGLTRLELITVHMNQHIPSEKRATVLSSVSMFNKFALFVVNPGVGLLVVYSLPLALVVIGVLPLLVYIFSPLKEEMLESR